MVDAGVHHDHFASGIQTEPSRVTSFDVSEGGELDTALTAVVLETAPGAFPPKPCLRCPDGDDAGEGDEADATVNEHPIVCLVKLNQKSPTTEKKP